MIKRDTVFWIVVSVVAIGALSMSAATIETTLSTDPADVINPDYDTVPIGQDTAETIRQEMESTEWDGESTEDTRTAPVPQTDAASGGERPLNGRSTTSDRSLLDRLLDILVYVLMAVAGVTIAVAAIYRRNQLLELLTYAILPPESTAGGTVDSDRWPRSPPSNSVERTWAAMIHSLDPEHPEIMTPQEFAATAVEAGLDETAVARLTETFEEITYGGQAVTATRERIANECRDQLGLGRTDDE